MYKFMSYSYTIQDSGGNSGGLHQLKVFVYPDESDAEDVCENEVIPALIDACEQAYDSSSQIDYWEVSYTTENPDEWGSGEDKRDALVDFRDDLMEQDSVPTGSHLLINADEEGGVADGGDLCDDEDYNGDGDTNDSVDQPESSAWFDWSVAVYGTSGDSDGHIRNIAIQEAFHNFIDDCIDEVDNMTGGDEHDLGQVYSNYWNDTVSPMLSTYVSSRQENGDCQSGAWWDGDYTQVLTSCTKDALDETATQHYYGH